MIWVSTLGSEIRSKRIFLEARHPVVSAVFREHMFLWILLSMTSSGLLDITVCELGERMDNLTHDDPPGFNDCAQIMQESFAPFVVPELACS